MKRSPRLHRTIDTPSGPVEVAVNRRGCTGEWTEQDDEALAALVRAAIAQYSPRPPNGAP